MGNTIVTIIYIAVFISYKRRPFTIQPPNMYIISVINVNYLPDSIGKIFYFILRLMTSQCWVEVPTFRYEQSYSLGRKASNKKAFINDNNQPQASFNKTAKHNPCCFEKYLFYTLS